MSPVSSIISHKASKRSLAAWSALTVFLSIAFLAGLKGLSQDHHLIYPVYDGETFPVGADEKNRTIVAVPEYFAGAVPKTVNGFTVQDVDGPKGQYQLVVWSRWTDDRGASGSTTSQIELTCKNKAGKAISVWQSAEVPGLSDPNIKIVEDWQHQGHQVFLILRRKGVNSAIADPVWVEGKTVHFLPSVSGQYIKIHALRDDGKHQLICHERAIPQTFGTPKIYRWDGSSFGSCDGSYRQAYSKLAKGDQSRFPFILSSP